MENKYILCIDLGTSGPKVSLVNTLGEVLMHEFEPTPMYFLPNGGAEQKPGDWWNAVKNAANRLIARHLVPAQDIVAISATSQWSTTVAVDKNGRPLMNAISWMDTRGAKYAKAITDGLIKIEGYGVTKLITWLKSHRRNSRPFRQRLHRSYPIHQERAARYLPRNI